MRALRCETQGKMGVLIPGKRVYTNQRAQDFTVNKKKRLDSSVSLQLGEHQLEDKFYDVTSTINSSIMRATGMSLDALLSNAPSSSSASSSCPRSSCF